MRSTDARLRRWVTVRALGARENSPGVMPVQRLNARTKALDSLNPSVSESSLTPSLPSASS